MELFNAEQSSTKCYSSGTCYPASNAIDGDWSTYSRADYATGNWLQVSMTNTAVYQIVLKATTPSSGAEITVSLYSGETLAGQCQIHAGRGSKRTLSCDRVTADRVRLTTTSNSRTMLYVGEIKVTGASINTIGI